ncbi:1269730a-5468-46ca-9003-1a0592d811ba [Thermothielavioides terrestris]|uniref:1269730a-5468-46ca-9003-1a0592d811ba n=1 Tax=Thermothielavioides terrestris TaxID=2587410 RepID=A0A3S4AIA9_9PEZI|nr:1269730a-5468-46ca-9003-1a0592d811ba [Thermothielavioides terrestris]
MSIGIGDKWREPTPYIAKSFSKP